MSLIIPSGGSGPRAAAPQAELGAGYLNGDRRPSTGLPRSSAPVQALNKNNAGEDVGRGAGGSNCLLRRQLAHEPERSRREGVSALRHGHDESDDAGDIFLREFHLRDEWRQ